jgi:hypothetical protein
MQYPCLGGRQGQQGVCHNVALPFTFTSMYVKAKKKNYGKLKYFTIQEEYNLQKYPLKKQPKFFEILELYN